MKQIIFCSLLVFGFLQCSSEVKRKVIGEDVIGAEAKPQSFQKIAPLTANALGARKNLHENGWFIVPSSKESAQEAYESGVMSFRTAKAMALVNMKERAEKYPGKLGDTMKMVRKLGKSEQDALNQLSKDIYSGTFDLAKWELENSGELFRLSGNKFINGYINLVDLEKNDREEIFTAIKKHNKDMNKTYKEIGEFFVDVSKQNGKEISDSWAGAYGRAVKEFKEEYDESGTRPNTLVALWDIFQGYTIALKELALAPVGKTALGSGEVILVNGVGVPVAYAITSLNQTIVTTGMVIYYPVKLGYRVVSPTMEAGFLSSIALLSASSTAPTLVAGTSMGAFNQVATVTGVESVRATGAVVGAGYETTATATGLIFDFTTGTAESVYYGLKSGIVISYAALTVIPTHILLSFPDGTFFLAWDGPRLVIAVVKGNYKGFEGLPVGSVVNLEEAKKSGKVEIVSDDPKLVKKVLEMEIISKEKDLENRNKGKLK